MAPVMLDPADVARLRLEVARVHRGEVDNGSSPYEPHYWQRVVEATLKGDKSVKKLNNSWWINETIRSLVKAPEIGEIAASLLGVNEIRLWHDQAICKPGLGEETKDDCGNIGWHQDYGYWQVSDTSEMITAWVALQDTDTKNGTLMTITTSHKWGLVPGSASFFDRDMKKLEDQFKQYGSWEVVPSIMKAGQIAFHHALTFHGSGPNNTDTDRLAIAVHMQPGNCGYKSGNGYHHNVKDLGPYAKDGDLFVGDSFPVLYKK
eukprot:TRINITY_DN1546_c1_g1_i6.p1 TRINITY_DN1546_c1_g1~~TRINITY_DN1546_c1_g1_i6.p1  ORF type:complete len:262 (-),score=40.14 TRINITY_DN1546_c1_g1_i6:355-1140(-)